eukprot:m.48616 g.48616  ORF g.48616 m.48616 type:complete len:237 (+) comp12416_c1_seq1:292-1002(+)
MRALLAVAIAAYVCACACAQQQCTDGLPMLYSTPYHHTFETSKARIQAAAPGFSADAVVGGEITQVDLASFRGKYVVLVFFPLSFTFVCPTELLAFNDRLAEFKDLNTEVLAMSVDSVYTLLAWTNTRRAEGGLGQVELPLLSDLTHKISKSYGVLLEDVGHTLRGLFIIDDKGILRQITMNDLPVGRSVDETLRLIKAFQFSDAHGVVCPAGWKPGDDTIVPNPQDKLDYFKKHN